MIALLQTLYFILDIAWFIVIASAIFSWLFAFNVINSSNQFVGQIGSMLYQLTEPMYRPIRRFMPNFNGIDLSPIVVLVIIFFLQRFIATSLIPMFG
jgi:YggT family protein